MFAGGYEEAAGDVEGLSQLFEQAQVDLEPWSCVTLYLWQRMGRVQEALDFAQKGVQAYRAVAHHQKNATKLQYAVVLLGLQVSILLGQARKSIVQPLEKKKEDLDVHSATRGEYLDRALKVAVEATSLASEDINAIEAHSEPMFSHFSRAL